MPSARGMQPSSCKICGKFIAYAKNLKKHMRTHQREVDKPFKCNICNVKFYEKYSLKRHKLVVHSVTVSIIKRSHKCAECGASFRQLANLNEHQMSHQFGRHACDVCKKDFTTIHSLLKHKLLHKNNEKKCGVCSKQFGHYSQLRRHAVKHVESLKCGICCKTFVNRSDLKIHIEYVHVDGITNIDEHVEVVKEQLIGSEEEVHKCSHCGIEYSQAEYLKAHMLFHADKQTRFSCKTCNKTFASLKSLESHIHIHTHKHSHDTEEEKQCKVPGEQFSNSKRLQCHMMVQKKEKVSEQADSLGNEAEELHVCQKCGKEYSRAVYLKAHMIKHDAKNRYKCKHCGKIFAQPRRLNTHLLIHTKEEIIQINDTEKQCQEDTKDDASTLDINHGAHDKHICKICGRDFNRVAYLKAHMHSHKRKRPQTANKQHKCSKCSSQFSKVSLLRAHMDEHIKRNKSPTQNQGTQKEIKCFFCSKKFHIQSAYRVHMKKHRDEKDPKCMFCGKRYGHLRYLKEHIETIHYNYRPHICKICDKQFKRPGILNTHMSKIHKISNPKILKSQCDLPAVVLERLELGNDFSAPQGPVVGRQKQHTSKSLSMKLQFEDKQKYHDGTITLECYICSKTVKVPWNPDVEAPNFRSEKPNELKSGIRAHTPQTCGICINEIADLETLRRHVLSHTRHMLIHM